VEVYSVRFERYICDVWEIWSEVMPRFTMLMVEMKTEFLFEQIYGS
jgi:hypothetical protein